MSAAATAPPRLKLCICRRNHARSGDSNGAIQRKTAGPLAKAMRIIAGFRAGKTLRECGEKPSRFDAYCAAHLKFAREAVPLFEASAKAALLRKGARRDNTHCKYGHPLFGKTVYIRRNGKRQGLICEAPR